MITQGISYGHKHILQCMQLHLLFFRLFALHCGGGLLTGQPNYLGCLLKCDC